MLDEAKSHDPPTQLQEPAKLLFKQMEEIKELKKENAAAQKEIDELKKENERLRKQ